MFKKQGYHDENFKKVETIIGPSVKVKGDFNSHGSIVVEGIIKGSVKTKGSLQVGEKAKITADIEAKEAKISGVIKGNVKVKGYLEITATAKISGDVEATSLSIERGATLNGKCTMSGDELNQVEKVKEEKK